MLSYIYILYLGGYVYYINIQCNCSANSKIYVQVFTVKKRRCQGRIIYLKTTSILWEWDCDPLMLFIKFDQRIRSHQSMSWYIYRFVRYYVYYACYVQVFSLRSPIVTNYLSVRNESNQRLHNSERKDYTPTMRLRLKFFPTHSLLLRWHFHSKRKGRVKHNKAEK